MALALYRRYRPDTFDGVIGQDQVTVPLMRALDENKLTHAYLFSGPRGCGKTSSARILARCVNCAKGPTSHPCGECASCRDLASYFSLFSVSEPSDGTGFLVRMLSIQLT